MSRIDRLTQVFTRFPGIGPRQAKRFVFFLLSQPKSFHNELADLLQELHDDVTRCNVCFRYFAKNNTDTICSLCRDTNRSKTLMVIEKDVDLDNIERAGMFSGKYFVLGGTVPILEKEPEKKVRIKELLEYLHRDDFDEVILAMSANPEGDHTANMVRKEIQNADIDIPITILGRGLSTGSELEYSDIETLRNAFKNRK